MENEFLKKTPKQSRSRAVVGALVSALEQLLDKTEDMSGISVQRVAERAGVGIGSLYDYFQSREGLFGEFVSRLTDGNFEKMRLGLELSRGQPLSVAIEKTTEVLMEVYLSKPNRTRAAIQTIARLGWDEPVIRERDRFAALMAERVCLQHPELPAEKVAATCRMLCDAIMGVLVTHLWRPYPDVRQALLSVNRAILEHELDIAVS